MAEAETSAASRALRAVGVTARGGGQRVRFWVPRAGFPGSEKKGVYQSGSLGIGLLAIMDWDSRFQACRHADCRGHVQTELVVKLSLYLDLAVSVFHAFWPLAHRVAEGPSWTWIARRHNCPHIVL